MFLVLFVQESDKEDFLDFSIRNDIFQVAETTYFRILLSTHTFCMIILLAMIASKVWFLTRFYQRDVLPTEAHVLVLYVTDDALFFRSPIRLSHLWSECQRCSSDRFRKSFFILSIFRTNMSVICLYLRISHMTIFFLGGGHWFFSKGICFSFSLIRLIGVLYCTILFLECRNETDLLRSLYPNFKQLNEPLREQFLDGIG
jgi:hypothetical protein